MTENCDDSNTVSGDGCSSTGQVESGKACTGEPSICGNIAYVGGSGSSDAYTCTGGTDDAAINNALRYVHTHAGYVGVRIRAGVLCTIVAHSLLLYNNTSLDGEPGAGLRMTNNAGWAQYVPMVGAAENPPHNLTLANLNLDGNRQNQNISAAGYFNALIVNNIDGLIVHDITIHDNNGDGFKVEPGTRLHFWHNSCTNIGHDCYYILEGSDNVRIHDDPVLSTGTNSGVRLVQVTHAKVYRETIHGIAHSCVQIQGSGSVEVRDMLCYDAVNGIGASAYGTHPANELTLWAHHNIIYSSRSSTTGRTSGIASNGFYSIIEQNSIAGIATGPGIGTMDTVDSGTTLGSGYTIQARGNILVSSLRGVDNVNSSQNTFSALGASCYWNNSSNYGNVSPGTNDKIGDPLFVNLAAGDYHLKSAGGHYAGGGWVTDAVTSQCIDAGDPAAPYDVETAPNGARANIGRYGDTAQASRSPGGAPVTPTAIATATGVSTATPPPQSSRSIFSTQAPGLSADPSPGEFGVRFRANQAGAVVGIKFYKGAHNTGTHTGNLWTNSGTLLSHATFTGETATGWQTVMLSTRVPVAANTTYVASYFTPTGYYAFNQAWFLSSGTTNAPLTALQSGVDGLSGIYTGGSSSTFPTQSWNQSNYWVDIIFQ